MGGGGGFNSLPPAVVKILIAHMRPLLEKAPIRAKELKPPTTQDLIPGWLSVCTV